MVRPANFLVPLGNPTLLNLRQILSVLLQFRARGGGTQFLHLVQNTKGLRQIIASPEANSCLGGCSGGGLGTIESVFVASPPRHCPPGHGESGRFSSSCAQDMSWGLWGIRPWRPEYPWLYTIIAPGGRGHKKRATKKWIFHFVQNDVQLSF